MAFTGAMFGNIDTSMGINNDGTAGGAVGVAGGPFDPVAMTANYGLNRHGSVEQQPVHVGNVGDYLNSISVTGVTPKPSRRRTPARSPRARSRSPVAEEEDLYEDRRNRREPRRNDEPVGFGFRLT